MKLNIRKKANKIIKFFFVCLFLLLTYSQNILAIDGIFDMVYDIPSREWTEMPPRNFYSYNNKVYFENFDEEHGYELWVTNGTETGTYMVKDIYAGIDDSNITNFYAFNNILYFIADDGIHGSELWRSDGTEAGTYMVKDICVGTSLYSCVENLIGFGDYLYFAADDGINGSELWRSDGTEAGTSLFMNIHTVEQPWAGSYPLESAIVINDILFFSATTEEFGNELWRTDGTLAGTYMVKDISYLWGSSLPMEFVNFGDILYFAADHDELSTELWRSDGTEAGTYMVKDIFEGYRDSSPIDFKVMGDKLYFIAMSAGVGYELWASDGTEIGTYLVKNINEGIKWNGDGNSSYPQNLTVMNGILYFTADDGIHGDALWRSDGTESGTYLFLNFNENESSEIWNLTVNDNKLYFIANSHAIGTNQWAKELWETDGTEEGTILLKEKLTYEDYNLGLFNATDKLYFVVANDFESNYQQTGFIWQKDLELWTYTFPVVHVAPLIYTVNFKDYNGDILKSQEVEENEGASAPSNPTRTGYIFTGWDKTYNIITSNLTVTALYSKIEVPKIPTPTQNPTQAPPIAPTILQNEEKAEEKTSEPILNIINITERLTTNELDNYNYSINLIKENKTLIDLYEISLLLDGEKIQPKSELEIRIIMSEEQKKYSNLEVAYIDDLKNITIIPHRIEDDYIIFNVSHLSHYAVIGEMIYTTTDINKTISIDESEVVEKNNNSMIFVFGGGILLMIIIITIITKKRRKK